MKYALIFLTAALLAQNATAAECDALLSERMECQVVSVQGRMSSFLTPSVGDKITLDTAKATITELEFDRGTMIPLLKPLVKQAHPDSGDHLVYFKSVQHDGNVESGTTTVMIGRFKDGFGNFVRSATIQTVTLAKHSGLISVDEIKLACQLVP